MGLYNRKDNMNIQYPTGIYKGPTNNNAFVRYKGKTYTIPKPFDQCFFGDEPTKMMTIGNRFNDESGPGQFAKLPAFAVAIYDTIIGCEATEDYDTMQKGLTWFQKYFTDEYYTLLD